MAVFNSKLLTSPGRVSGRMPPDEGTPFKMPLKVRSLRPLVALQVSQKLQNTHIYMRYGQNKRRLL